MRGTPTSQPARGQNAELRIRHFVLVFLASLALLTSPALAEDQATPKERPDHAARGREVQSRVYADIPPDDPWLQMSQEHLFAQIWTRPGLTMRDRRLIALTAAAYASSPAGYIAHLGGALDNQDLTPAELWEWLIQFTQYAGYPKAAPVWAELRIALAQRGLMPLPKSLGPGRDSELDRQRAKPRSGASGK